MEEEDEDEEDLEGTVYGIVTVVNLTQRKVSANENNFK